MKKKIDRVLLHYTTHLAVIFIYVLLPKKNCNSAIASNFINFPGKDTSMSTVLHYIFYIFVFP